MIARFLPLLLLLLAPSAVAVEPVVLSHQRFDVSAYVPIGLTALGVGGVAAAVYVAVATEVRPGPRRPAPAREARLAARPTAKPAAPKPRPTAAAVPARAARREPAPVPVAVARAGQVRVRIEFPAVPRHFPDVWGVHEPLAVEVRAAAGAEHAAEFEVTIGSAVVRERLTARAENGAARFERAFANPMDLRISATARDAAGRGTGFAEREVRIVDYRTEIIETFTDFRVWAMRRNGDLDARPTAREFLERLGERHPQVPARAWDDVAVAFEEAHYSDHAITRATYARMVEGFLALEEAGLLGP